MLLFLIIIILFFSLLKTHFWCGATTKFNQRSRTCQAEDNVVCSISERYYHLNQDFLVPGNIIDY